MASRCCDPVHGIHLLRCPACFQGNRSGVLDVAAAQPVPM